MIYSDSDLRSLQGIGEKKALAFHKLGIDSVYDLLSYYPRRYEDRSLKKDIFSLEDGETVCIEATVAENAKLSRIRKGLDIVKFRAFDSTGIVEISYFNQSYLKTQFTKGDTFTFYGKVTRRNNRISLTNPVFDRIDRTGEKTGRIVPIYRLSAGLTQKNISDSVKTALDLYLDSVPEMLCPDILDRNELVHASFAYKNIHFPADHGSLDLARRRLIFEELFLLSCALRSLRDNEQASSGILLENDRINEFFQSLPFSPTGAQFRAIDQCIADLRSGKVMNRLLQGDVGSGKTLVAAALIFYTYCSGHSSALMAPTEVLAEQHFRNLSSLFAFSDLRIELLTGSTSAKDRKRIRQELLDGTIDLLIGTHALFSGDIDYKDLALIITDEQHRFGVNQRSALVRKATNPHVLVMSATPIPRSLALIIYGDLDVSVLDVLPPGRKPVETFHVTEEYRARILRFIRKQAEEGHQIYVVCPKVEEDETGELKSAKMFASELQKALPDLHIEYMHGKQSAKEKERVMRSFTSGETDVLVSTTVIEVGVDVPNASLMIVENAERFGLSQLHQLRGRVGRGADRSYCILVSDHETPEVKARLEILCSTGDGFKVAEEDLRLRGPGDFFGERQHGLPEMHIADLGADILLLQKAHDEAIALLKADPLLEKEENRILKEQIGFLLRKNTMIN